MKKILCLALFACLLFPTLGHAGIQGKYHLDKKAMFAQFMKLIEQRKVPPKMRKMIVARMKKQLNSRDMWMVLKGKETFEGWVKKADAKKPRMGAKGTWTLTKKKLVINSVDTKRKKKNKMICKVDKSTLICKDARNPKITVHFIKKG